MSGTDWLVVAGGVAAIAWVNWYFFVAGRAGSGGQPPGDELGQHRRMDDGNDRG